LTVIRQYANRNFSALSFNFFLSCHVTIFFTLIQNGNVDQAAEILSNA